METFDIYGSHTADSKPVKQEVNSSVILSPLVFPVLQHALFEEVDGGAFVQDRGQKLLESDQPVDRSITHDIFIL